MRNRLRPNDVRAARRAGMAAAVMAGVIAGGIAAVPADAASAHKAGRSSYRHHYVAFERPELKRGTLIIEGTRAGDRIALRLKAGRPDILQIDAGDDGSADFSVRRKFVARIVVDGRAGDDSVRIDETNGIFTDSIPTTLDGGDGNDNLAGGTGVEKLRGGDGNDTLDGNGGNDLAQLGSGDDTFVWDPGDGSDTIAGDAGTDTMVFNGAAAAEHVDLSANGNRLRFFRDPGAITMDTNGVETVDFNALGGADAITVNDLTGTDVRTVNADLAGTLGGVTGDGATDSVVVNGTNGNDRITAAGSNGAVSVTGLATAVQVAHAEPAGDTLALNALAGNDGVDASALQANAVKLAVDGGAGNDALTGSAGNDSLLGGDGDDTLRGGPGIDVLDGGGGTNVLVQD